ncbi:hypothetical protein B484DRAFT_433703 [Ochromonadaceae sp. CCMP2298]|nr:hypothetical protein B484DRAFT_433703 [Ochromonadaceae sp. CCMP2298]
MMRLSLTLLLATAFFGQCFGIKNLQTSQLVSLRGSEPMGSPLGARLVPNFAVLAKLHEAKDLALQVKGQEAKFHALASTNEGGFMFFELYVDSSCSKVIASGGVAADVCIEQDNYAYIIRLADDSCKGVTVEYYADQACTEMLAQGPLDTDTFTSCRETPPSEGVFWSSERGVCTTSSSIPEIAQQTYVQTYSVSADPSCKSADSFVTFSTGACITNSASESFTVDCKKTSMGYSAKGNVYVSSACQGAAVVTDEDRPCLFTADDDDDFYADDDDDSALIITAPPSAATVPFPNPATYNYQAYCAGEEASETDNLSLGAVLGIIAGAVVFVLLLIVLGWFACKSKNAAVVTTA